MSARRSGHFGCPDTGWPHCFRVNTPAKKGGTVDIIEDFGVAGHADGRSEVERLRLSRERWGMIAQALESDFNGRLAAKGLPRGAWRAGAVKVERMLGQELLLLARLADVATGDDIAPVLDAWRALRPEERWWLAGTTGNRRRAFGALLMLTHGDRP